MGGQSVLRATAAWALAFSTSGLLDRNASLKMAKMDCSRGDDVGDLTFSRSSGSAGDVGDVGATCC